MERNSLYPFLDKVVGEYLENAAGIMLNSDRRFTKGGKNFQVTPFLLQDIDDLKRFDEGTYQIFERIGEGNRYRLVARGTLFLKNRNGQITVRGESEYFDLDPDYIFKYENGGEIEDDDFEVEDDGFEPDDDDCFIYDNTRGGYDVSCTGDFIGNYEDFDEAVEAVKSWQKENNWFPNVWFINDHGNASIVDIHTAGDLDEYARGGFVSKGELVWGRLTASKRADYLYKNFTPGITPRGQELLVGKAFRFLPKNVKSKIESDFANVDEYAKGGGVYSWESLTIEKMQKEFPFDLSKLKRILKDACRNRKDAVITNFELSWQSKKYDTFANLVYQAGIFLKETGSSDVTASGTYHSKKGLFISFYLRQTYRSDGSISSITINASKDVANGMEIYNSKVVESYSEISDYISSILADNPQNNLDNFVYAKGGGIEDWEGFYKMSKSTEGINAEYDKKYDKYTYNSPHIQDILKRSKSFEEFTRLKDKFYQPAQMGSGGEMNANYLDTIPAEMKSRILKNIAAHYGISPAEAEEEVRDADAEMLYEYIANDQRLRMDVYREMQGRKYANGGEMGGSSLGTVNVKFANPKYNYSTNVSPEMTEADARKYFVGKFFDVGTYPKENLQKVTDIEFIPGAKMANGGEMGADKMEVAKTIYAQIGRLTFAMLGAYNFVGDTNSLAFRIRGSKKANYIKITLTSMDDYTVEFGKIKNVDAMKAMNMTDEEYMAATYKVVNVVKGVYFDDLHNVIEENTGLYTKFAAGGEMCGCKH